VLRKNKSLEKLLKDKRLNIFTQLSEKFKSTLVDISEPVVQHLTQLLHKFDYYFS